MPDYCPHCHEEIDRLFYEAEYNEWGWESGTCSPQGDDWNCEDRNGDNYENNGEVNYSCPHCEHHLDPDDVLEELPGEDECTAEEVNEYVEGLSDEELDDILEGEEVIHPSSEFIVSQTQKKQPKSIECPECHAINFRDLNEACICTNCNHEIE